MSEEINLPQVNLCWYVGAVWNDTDMTDKFISEGYWENGWDDKFKSLVNQIQVGDKIAIKSTYTQKNNLPFDINNRTASVMAIKYVGTVTIMENELMLNGIKTMNKNLGSFLLEGQQFGKLNEIQMTGCMEHY